MSIGTRPEITDMATPMRWARSIPRHWQVARLGDHARLSNGFPFDSAGFSNNDGVPLVRIRDILKNATDTRWTGPIERSALIRNGDVLIGMDGDFNVGWWQGGEALLNQRVCCLRANKTLVPRFMFYFLPMPLNIINALTYSTTVKHLSSMDVLKIRFPLPPLEEQRAIAAFLDRETAKIDELIAKKQRLIELLKEKRQAEVSHAVTKGLDLNVKLKPSGVAWLGHVPSHWKVAALRHFASFGTGSTPDRENPSYWNGDIPWVKTGEINYEPILATEETITEDGLKRSACWIAPKGTLLIALYGQGETRGRVAILSIPAAFNQACVAISPKHELLVDYLHAYFEFAYSHIRDVGNETTQMNMSMGFVRRIPVALPPVEEQTQIVALVHDVRESLKSTRLAVLNAIQRLIEYRSALISAAVAGQIDVRHYHEEAPCP